MNESELLSHIYTRSAGLREKFPQVLVGPGDDCAVIAGTPPTLLKVDQLVATRHFIPGTAWDLVGRKAIARPLSDIAAAGGSPVAALTAAALPAGFVQANDLFDAMARWSAHFNCPLVGGDIATHNGPLVLSVSIMGRPHESRGPVLRSGARVGDGVYVTGSLGGSFERRTGLGRHLTFEPRLAEAKALCDTLGPRLHAMMDISDGLGADSNRIAAASRVRIRLDAASLPKSPGITDWKNAASDGEDYELLFAAAGDVPRECGGTPITRIGTVELGSGCVMVDGGAEVDASTMGWEHGRAAGPPPAQ